jgi:RsiW-degrading membrane proteinase PrsW (M82 family)
VITLSPFLISIVPVFLFLLALVFLDSYKLVKFTTLAITILAGCISAFICLLINRSLLISTGVPLEIYYRYFGPFFEELFKALFIIWLLRRNKIGFLVDAAIMGFAMGTGFAVIENIYYIRTLGSSNPFLWLIRGLGTAVMHGGTTSIFAILSKSFIDRYLTRKFYVFLPGFLAAFFIHSVFNHFLLPAPVITAIQLLVLPALIFITFNQSEKYLREWLEISMDIDVWLLDYINSGRVSQTKIGQYIYSLKNQFPGEIVADMLCYIRLHLELAIRSKGILMMRETGFPVQKDPEIREKLNELKYLEKSIGKTGRLAISPILHTSTQELWQLGILDK